MKTKFSTTNITKYNFGINWDEINFLFNLFLSFFLSPDLLCLKYI